MTFHQISRVLALSATVVVGTLLFSGCTVATPITSPSASNSPQPQPQPSATTPPLTDPISAFAIDCAELVPDDVITAVLGDHQAPVASLNVGASVRGSLVAAILQDGGISCTWSRPQDHNALFPALSVVAIPDAADFFDRAVPVLTKAETKHSPVYTSADAFDATLVKCQDGYEGVNFVCEWSVLSGDTWIALQLAGMPDGDVSVPAPRSNPDTSLKGLVPVVDGSASLELVTDVVTSLASAPRNAVNRVSADLPSCTKMLKISTIQKGTGFTVSRIASTASLDFYGSNATADVGFAIWNFSFERLGYRQCFVGDADPGAYSSPVLTVSRNIEWLMSAPYGLSDGKTALQVENLGIAFTECTTGIEGEGCVLTAQRGDLLVIVQYAGKKQLDVAVAITRSVFASIPSS
jgi:hypothetical protein